MEYLFASLRSRAIISPISSFTSANCRFDSPFFEIERMRLMMSAARFAFRMTPRRSLARLSQIGIVSRKPPNAGAGAVDSRGNGLIHFVRQGGGQLSHGGHPAGVSEIRLRLAQPLPLFLRLPAVGDVDDGTHIFNEIAGWAENGMAYERASLISPPG
jgi:hypothetical protein